MAIEQREHQMVGRPADVAHARHQHAARPQRQQRADHREAGQHAERLDELHQHRHRLQEIAQMAQPRTSASATWNTQPNSQIHLLERNRLSNSATSRSTRAARTGAGDRRRRRRDLQRNRRRGILPDAIGQPAGEDQRHGICQDDESHHSPPFPPRAAASCSSRHGRTSSSVTRSRSASADRRSCTPAWPGRRGTANRDTSGRPSPCRTSSSSP